MRGRFIIAALLVLALHGCGSGDSSSTETPAGAQKVAIHGTTVAGRDVAETPAEKPSGTESGSEPATAREAPAGGPPPSTFVPAASKGRAPAVLFVHDLAGAGGRALAEARRLARNGIASLVLTGAHGASPSARAFAADVAKVQAAIEAMRRRDDVDPNRIALIGEGNGARLAAVVLGRARGALRGAVLADLGVAGGGGGKFAPQRWLARAGGASVLLQRSTSRDRTTDAELKELLLAAPPGTNVYSYKTLGSSAQAQRDEWLRGLLA